MKKHLAILSLAGWVVVGGAAVYAWWTMGVEGAKAKEPAWVIELEKKR